MSSQIRIVKKDRESGSKKPQVGEAKTERQRNREIVAVVKSWIEELELRRQSNPAPASVWSR
ncbi:MAG TPA: hypothetical protein VKD91_07795 [Pyrinomonadaceae bacterium]|nr:hypothetical protein [Pyrinomonadaceae bacterium]